MAIAKFAQGRIGEFIQLAAFGILFDLAFEARSFEFLEPSPKLGEHVGRKSFHSFFNVFNNCRIFKTPQIKTGATRTRRFCFEVGKAERLPRLSPVVADVTPLP